MMCEVTMVDATTSKGVLVYVADVDNEVQLSLFIDTMQAGGFELVSVRALPQGDELDPSCVGRA